MRDWRRSQTLEAKLNAMLKRNAVFKCDECQTKSAKVKKLISGASQICLEYHCDKCNGITTKSVNGDTDSE